MKIEMVKAEAVSPFQNYDFDRTPVPDEDMMSATMDVRACPQLGQFIVM